MAAREVAYIGLGANVGPAQQTLERAIAALAALPGASLRGVSRLYHTRPVGPVAQDDFRNAAAALDVPADPHPEHGARALLVGLKGIERDLGRQERQRWGPREVDLDLLLYGAHRIRVGRAEMAGNLDPAPASTPWLEVPHPRAAERLFVLAPLADLAPDLVPTGWEVSVAQARDRALELEGPDAVRAIGAWDANRSAWAPSAG